MSTRVLSFHDLMLDSEFKKAVTENNKQKMDELLYQVGVDVSQGWNVIERLHRPLSFKNYEEPIYGPMVEYSPRTDKEWLKSGYATTEEVIDATTDSFLRAELMTMSKQSNFTGDSMNKYGSNSAEDIEEKL